MTDQDQPGLGPARPAPLSEDIEAREIEGEIRSTHQPALHMGTPCPSGTCCSCGAEGGCEAGTLIVMLDAIRQELAVAQEQAAEENRHRARAVFEGFRLAQERDTARAEAQRHSAERNALAAFVEGIRDKIVPEGDEAAYLNALKWAAPIVLRSAKSLTVPTPAAPVAQAAQAGEEPWKLKMPDLTVRWGEGRRIPADQPAGGEHVR